MSAAVDPEALPYLPFVCLTEAVAALSLIKSIATSRPHGGANYGADARLQDIEATVTGTLASLRNKQKAMGLT
jgi:hypothetical protein